MELIDNVRYAKLEDLEIICSMEQVAYKAGDEDKPEHIKYRIENANSYFLVFVDNTKKQIIGYINGIVTKERDYNKKLLNMNDDNGNTLCIHSFVLDINFRRNGLGKKILEYYISYIKNSFKNIQLIILISKEELAKKFYSKFGFTIYNKIYDDWYELKLEIS